MNSLVSIIIPTFNRTHFIGETLDSVLAQTYKNWECIVVDDSSNDYTNELLEFYILIDSRIKYYHRPKNRVKGANACRNYGVEKSSGMWLMFLDSDDLLANFTLENRVVASLEATGDFIVFPMQYFRKEKGDVKKLVNRYSEVKSNYIKNFLKHDFPWPITSLFIRNKRHSVNFNENLMRLQDVDFSVRLLLQVKNNFTINKGKVDCFYRNEQRHLVKHYSNSFINLTIQSYIIYFDSIHRSLITINGMDYTPFHKISFLRFNKQFFLPNIRKNFKSAIKLKRMLMKYGYISTPELIKLLILDLLYAFNLHRYAGTGTYRLTKRWLG